VPGLAAALVEVVKGDLPPVNVEPAYDPHGASSSSTTVDAPRVR
jgi:hypothetical protein